MTGVTDITRQPGQFVRTDGEDRAKGGDFAETLSSFVRNVDTRLKEADRLTQDFAAGKNQDLHVIMIENEKAALSFKLLLQIRNKLLEAYNEIMRMQF